MGFWWKVVVFSIVTVALNSSAFEVFAPSAPRKEDRFFSSYCVDRFTCDKMPKNKKFKHKFIGRQCKHFFTVDHFVEKPVDNLKVLYVATALEFILMERG